MLSQATYIWIDGAMPTKKLRSKVKILTRDYAKLSLSDLPEWSFDGSSTYQAIGHDSDLTLTPVRFVKDPTISGNHYLVLCEVNLPDGSPHSSNSRAKLRDISDSVQKEHQPWIGFEQEYVLFHGHRPLGWPESGYPAPQGPFYCGVGSDEVFGRELVDEHTLACLEAGLMLFGTNAEVMPGQWEFQIGYRGIEGESADPLTVSDHLWLTRWLLYRLGEKYNISATLAPKPVKGDWNGSGMHTNFSTRAMRDPKTGLATINAAIERLKTRHMDHIRVYGDGLEQRLTGKHETAPLHQFSAGVSNRGASVRIPNHVAKKGCGYLEDRRPGANADPYEVATALLTTICATVTQDAKITV